MNELARVLKALRDEPASLQAAVDVLEREAPTPEEREQSKDPGILYSN